MEELGICAQRVLWVGDDDVLVNLFGERGSDNCLISKPLNYFTTCKIISVSKFVITDSGGIQEECATIGIPTVVCRKVTERKEALKIGIAKVSSFNNKDLLKLLNWAKNKKIKKWIKRPYGDGNSAKKITRILLDNI